MSGLNLIDTTAGAGDTSKAGGDKLNVMLGELFSRHVLRGVVSRKRMTAKSTTSLSSGFTVRTIMRAPAHYDAVQIILHMGQGDSTKMPSGNVGISVAPSAKAGVDPVDSSGAAVTPTAITWGTTDPANPRNPGGGAADIAVAVAVNSVDGFQIENDYTSDIVTVRSLDRTDTVGAPPLIHVNVYAPSYTPNWTQTPGSPQDAVVDPDLLSGTASGDKRATTAGTLNNNNIFVPVTVIFYHRGTRVLTIAAFGDSTMQGSNNSSGTAVDSTQSLWNGFMKKLTNKLIAGGQPTNLINGYMHGNVSGEFHERAINALLSSQGRGIDVLAFYPWSVNDGGSTLANWLSARKRCIHIINLCHKYGVRPLLVMPMPGYDGGPSGLLASNGFTAFMQGLIAGGHCAVYDPAVALGNTQFSYAAMPAAGRLHDSSGAVLTNGDTHPNEYAHETVASDMYAKRVQLGIV